MKTKNNGRPIYLASWEEVDQKIRRMGEIDIAVQVIEGELTLKVNEIRDKAEAEAEGLKSERTAIEEAIANFVEDHKDEFAKTRSRELSFGIVAFRVVKKIVIRSKEACVAALHALKLDQYVRIIEEPDKEAMSELEDNVLAKVGAKRKVEDKLRIEPYLEKIREAA